jgi:restriction system protein
LAQSYYFIEIQNEYLGKHRRVTGRTRREVEIKAAEQLQRWSEQEARAREREAIANAKEQAALDTEAALEVIDQWRNVLKATLAVDDRLDWAALVDDRPYTAPAPSKEQIEARLNVPRPRPLIETLMKSARRKREEAEAEAERLYQKALAKWEEGRQAHERRRSEQYREVQEFRSAYEAGEPSAVEKYVSLVLAASVLPPGFPQDANVMYDASGKVLLVERRMPSPEDVPRTIAYRFVATRRVMEEKQMKEREAAALYEDAVIQATLRTIHEVFEGDYAGHCATVVVNGTVRAVDRATGRDFEACIVSCQASREEFESIDLSRVDPRACFRNLKGLSGSKLAGLQPVRPILSMNREDPRFIEADGVLEGLEADQNLMTMEWQEFEVLIRDLFEEMFKSRGADVRVTRSSRDQGVDAVVFDPDPLTGGKIVIQAKRYRNAVPVAAVRELYGTMINEGAGRGILVTTSHFGGSAREFAKDKPLTLIDGSNLLHYLQNHGHRVRIDMTEATGDDPVVELPA